MKSSYNTHFYLYAKGHYKKTSNPLNDLKIILSDYTGVGIEHLNEKDVLRKLLEICEPFVTNKCEGIGFLDFISRLDPDRFNSQKNFYKDLLSACLSVLSVQKVSTIELYDGKIGNVSKNLQKRITKGILKK
jgi:hypothetical protein